MAKPTKVPTWATDADYSNGPEVGTPTKADPGAGVQAEGYIPQTRLAAQVINWWQNLVGQWTSWLDSTFAGGDGDPIEFLEPLDSVHSLGPVGTADDFLYVDESGAPDPKQRTARFGVLGLRQRGTTTAPVFIGDGVRASLQQSLVVYVMPLDLPPRSVIRSIRVLLQPGTARASTNDRMRVRLLEVDAGDAFSSLTIASPVNVLASALDDGTADVQIVQVTGIDHDVKLGSPLVIEVRSGATATSDNDAVSAVEIVYDQLGPS